MRQAYRELGAAVIAVRSSALDEDSSAHSFAGQLSTFLFVRSEDEAVRCVKECWASGYSERGLSYRKQNGMDLSKPISVGVVLQEMVDSERSGVMFTCDPIGGDAGKVTVNALYGVGEGLVSGLLDGDTFTLDKATGAKLREELAHKESQLVRKENAHEGTVEIPVDAELQDVACLSEDELRELAELGRRIERFYRFPQDIEWGHAQGKFYLLQSRPITTGVRNEDGLLYIWDNSNIVESYGGITLPLTFTFAHHVYHSVYVQFCEILMVPAAEIRKMDPFLRNMLGISHGRIFYNILNWYKLTSILPGFKYNRAFMETMMGTHHALQDEIADRIKPPASQETRKSKLKRFVSGLKFFWFHLTIQRVVDDFMRYFTAVYTEFRQRPYSRMTSDEIWRAYQELEERLLSEWKAPIINDFLCMIHFGVLKKLTAKWLGHLGEGLQNDLLCGEGNLESAEPTRELIRMAELASRSLRLRELLERTGADACFEVLHHEAQRAGADPAIAEFMARVARYIDLYGFRCMNEMKLEETDLYQDPAFLFTCLKNYLRAGQTDLDEYEKREKEIRAGAEAKVRANLSGLRSLVYHWSLRHARKAVKNRENTRFCRTRIYGVVRAMFHGIGRDFTARGILDKPEDVFYIEMREMAGALEGTLTAQNLKALVELRKAEYARYEGIEPASRFMTRGPVYWMNQHTPIEAEVEIDDGDLPPNAIKGIGCCPGIVEGTVKVILSPKDDMELNGDILVTMRTDPGWIPLFPSASALLVERGGLLSHSAIVAREMGIPAVVGVKGLVARLKTGMRVRMNGETGIIEILSEGEGDSTSAGSASSAPGLRTEAPLERAPRKRLLPAPVAVEDEEEEVTA